MRILIHAASKFSYAKRLAINTSQRQQAFSTIRPFFQAAVKKHQNDGAPLPPQPPPPPSSTKLRQRLASSLHTTHENIWNLPNALTLSRIVAAPIVGYLVLHDQHAPAVALFAYAGITDLLDGWLARRWKLQTVIGSIVDPMADKMLMTILVVCLAVKCALPLYLATIILGRDVSLSLAAFYYRYASLPPPKTLTRYFDFSLPSAQVHPIAASKWNTALQLGLIGCTTALPLLTLLSEYYYHYDAATSLMVTQGMLGLQVLTAALTVGTGLSYVWLKNAVTILGEDEALKKKQGIRGRFIIGSSFSAFLVLATFLAWREHKQDAIESTRQGNES